jgi:hypothetical protein
MIENLATLFGSITAFLFGVLGLLHFAKRPKVKDRRLRTFLWGMLATSFVVSLAFQWTASVQNRNVKSDLAFHFEENFDKLRPDRIQAAAAINEYLGKGKNWDGVTNENELDGLESVLSFFEELGYQWKNEQISSQVLHEYFYSDMRTYCQESLSYIHKEQQKESKADYEYVEPLFNELTRIEAKKIGKDVTNCVWDDTKLNDYLKSEMRLKKN